jgi:putative toxin-antitoxin system antitoxin component (TIGR02293 family)
MSQTSEKSSTHARLRRRSKAQTSTPSVIRPLTTAFAREESADDDSPRKRAKAITVEILGNPSRHKIAPRYRRGMGVDEFVRLVASATPMQIVEIERTGVVGSFIKDLSKRMEIPSSRIFTILGVPKATAEKKAAAGEMVAGSGGQAVVGMVRLLAIAQEIVANSTASEAEGFDAAKWLGQWIERPQPSLGGRKPADLLDAPTGIAVVTRLLGSIESGAYQ